MDLKDIRTLVEVLESSTINKLHYKKDTEELILEKSPSSQGAANSFAKITTDVKATSESFKETIKTEASSTITGDVADIIQANIIQIKAPLVGVFYHASNPEAEPFVSIGKQVKKGDTLCIIEAMKVLNEIKAPIDGKVAAIQAKNGDVVSYDQILMELGE